MNERAIKYMRRKIKLYSEMIRILEGSRFISCTVTEDNNDAPLLPTTEENGTESENERLRLRSLLTSLWPAPGGLRDRSERILGSPGERYPDSPGHYML